MHIIKVDNNVFDVFTGMGWDNWSRVRVSRSGPFVVTGHKLPYVLLRNIAHCLTNKAPDKQDVDE